MTTEHWSARAACRDQDPDIFYPVGHGDAALADLAAARQMCGACDVSRECLSLALTVADADGVWAGTTPDERRALRAAE